MPTSEKPSDWRIVMAPLGGILLSFWKASRETIVLAAAVVIGASLASVFAPYLFSRLVDRLSADPWLETISAGLLIYAVVIGLSLALQSIVNYLAAMSAEDLNFIADTRFFERLVKKSPRFFVEHNPAEIQSAQMQGAQALIVVVELALMALIPGLVQLALTLAVLSAAIDARVVLVVLVYGAVFIPLTYFSNKWTRPHLEKATTAGQANAQLVGNAISSMETLRYFASCGWMSDRFRRGAEEVLHNWRSYCLKRIAYAGIYGLALALQYAVTFAILLPSYRQGIVSVGDIVLFNALLIQLNQPFEMVGSAIESLMRSYAQFRPFADMWAYPEESDLTAARGEFATGDGRLEFENVSFSYEDGRGIADVGFVAQRGAITFITGETGSGKSTVLRLALKTLEPCKGQIRVDGVDLRDVNRQDWYGAVGVVPQDVMLLNDTLAANIALGRPIIEQRLREAAAKAAILDRIEEYPAGFATIVGERGLKLSGGERQRIAIARALYGEPKFLFLDEASSALDETTEAAIMDHIRKIVGEVTVLAITHRKSTIHHTDNVVDLHDRAGVTECV
ncbi:ABC transporter ATP-binding protein [Sinorhizobium sp. 8-89]|uniref:ABC transporter ATP-binding protein n=1 Tax=Sinorhizobium sp. 7-81 TaxID=3049087 RepID=UPI0024C23EE2|nr:ABC transporter ATP-binding protein [Sinorhizobium sp. 7-81]MDK1389736.1 ABC transporter ATP-binding protein [Sinorhizobium sp. 7-81]